MEAGKASYFFEEWELEVKSEAEKRVRQIGKLLKEAEQVIHAGDVDEEGQLLIDELLRWHHYSGTVKRLDTSSLTEGDLKRAFANLKGNQKLLKQKGKRGKLLPDKELLRLLEQKIMTEKYSPGAALAYIRR